MADRLGDDFDLLQPDDGDLVKNGAWWIRDIKRRLRNFISAIFNPETGQVLDGKIQSEALQSLVPSPEGTWQQVTVNDKGLVTAGANLDVQPTARPFQAVFLPTGAYYETPDGVLPAADKTDKTYAVGDSAVKGSYTAGCQLAVYTWTVPDGVTRLRALIVGGGGAGIQAADSASPGGGGGGAAYAEAGFAVSPGDVVTVLVGNGGSDSPGGGPSGVHASGNWVETAGGASASTSGGGAGGTQVAASMTVLSCAGQAGTSGTSAGASLIGVGKYKVTLAWEGGTRYFEPEITSDMATLQEALDALVAAADAAMATAGDVYTLVVSYDAATQKITVTGKECAGGGTLPTVKLEDETSNFPSVTHLQQTASKQIFSTEAIGAVTFLSQEAAAASGRSGFYLLCSEGRPYGSGGRALTGFGSTWTPGMPGVVILQWIV